MTASGRRGSPRTRGARGESSEERVLVLDCGNTKTAYALFRGGRLRLHGAFETAPATAPLARRRLAGHLRRRGVDAAGSHAVLASVVPAATTVWLQALSLLTGARPLVVGVDRIPGLVVRVPEPASVGADRLANALGVVAAHGAPAIVVDLGTATTLDVIDGRGRFLGGAIAPGAGTGADALFRAAARLRPVPLRAPRRALGRSTAEALLSGIVLGHAGLVDGLVTRLAAGLRGTPCVIATGGLARLVAPHSATIQKVDGDLTVRGLYEAHRRRSTSDGAARGRR